MSAWIVSRAHIDAMVQGLCESEIVVQDPDEVGRALWAENLASVAYRYPDDGDGERPGPIDFRDADVVEYTYRRPSARLTRHDLLIALQCWDYQSCEHTHDESEPWRWVKVLLDRLEKAGAEKEPETKQTVNGYPHPIAWDLAEEHVHPATNH